MGEKLKVLDLFSGIGGFALGLEAAGMETVAFCEVAPSCRHLLATHWPEVPCYDDVKTLTGERLAADGIRVDALCGGFPCQDLSYAGKGAGLAGERSGLWFEIARILRELRDLGRPVRIVILENVSALLGRGLGVVLGDLAALGYDAEWDCIPASAVGAPHQRDRIWIVAYARGLQHEGFGDAFRRALAEELPRAFAWNTGLQAWDDDQAVSQHPDADRIGSHRAGKHVNRDAQSGDQQVGVFGPLGEVLADAKRNGRSRPRMPENSGHTAAPRGRKAAHAQHGSFRGKRPTEPGVGVLANGLSATLDSLHGVWSEEPEIARVAAGVPARAEQLHGLGNAVVPHIPKTIGRAILSAVQSQRQAA